jgi:hypothetical protein
MRTAIPLTVLATALACSLAIAPAQARARVFVASYGTDFNACTFGSPCKTFQHAVDVVDAGGEVTAIDSAGFGPMFIGKAVSITSPLGIEAGIVPNAGATTAIDVSAGPNDAVVLRGLTVSGGGAPAGILFNSGASLTLENCVISGFTDGIKFIPNTTTKLFISNSQISGNSSSGIFVFPSGSGTTSVSLSHVETNNNGNWGTLVDGANLAGGQIGASISDSVASGNGDTGYYGKAGSVLMTIFRSVANFNGQDAVVADGNGATINLSRSMLQFSGHGDWATTFNGGSIVSWQDNAITFSPGNATPFSVTNEN